MMMETVSNTLRQLTSKNGYTTGLLLVAIIVAVGFSIAAPQSFFSILNVESIAYAVPEVALLALAISISMTTGGIDLSVVAVANIVALTSIWMSKYLLDSGIPSIITTLLIFFTSVIIGTVAGFLNGFLIAKVKIRPILATLATQQIFVGVSIVISKGEALYGGTDEMNILGIGTLLFVPLLFWILILVVVLLALIMGKTSFGVKALMLGENPVATDYSGISQYRVTLKTYMLCSVLSAIAGLFMAARTGSASAGFGGSYLMLAITIAVLGGANPFGGQIAVWGGALAAVILQMISSGLNALGFSAYIYQIVQGLILVAVFVVRWEIHSSKQRRRRFSARHYVKTEEDSF